MQIQVNSDNHIQSSARLEEWVRTTVESTLERYEEDLTRIDTQLAAIHDGATAAPDPGRPLTVTDVRGHLYVNFGDDWRTDTTAHLAPLVRRGLDGSPGAADLDGRRVRVRGWIEWRNGPFIDIHDAALLERVIS